MYLQCLAYTPVLKDLLSGDVWRSVRSSALSVQRHRLWDIGDGTVVEAFAELVNAMWFGRHRILSPKRFKAAMGKFRHMFAGWQQHDAQEFLAALLDGMHEDMNFASGSTPAAPHPPTSPSPPSLPPPTPPTSELGPPSPKREWQIVVAVFVSVMCRSLVSH